jgi:hypothetical protein
MHRLVIQIEYFRESINAVEQLFLGAAPIGRTEADTYAHAHTHAHFSIFLRAYTLSALRTGSLLV